MYRSILLSLWMILGAVPAYGAEFTLGKDWSEVPGDVPNPYRGFYCKTADRLGVDGVCVGGSGNVDFFADAPSANARRFNNTYEAGLRLVYDRLTFDPRDGKPISADDIQDIKDNLAATRGTGVKAILRLRPGGANTSDCVPEIPANANPAGPTPIRDMCRTRLENYTRQLAQALVGFEDTLAWIEIGGYGDTGEGVKSETFTTNKDGDGGYTDPCWKFNEPACDESIERWFDFQRAAYGKDIWLAIKKPRLGRAWTDRDGNGFSAEPGFAVTRDKAHDPNVRNARVAHYNDCIMVDRADGGVHHHPDGFPDGKAFTREWEKDVRYYSQQMRFTFGTGETCSNAGKWPRDPTISDCKNTTEIPDRDLVPGWNGLRYVHGGAITHLERLRQTAMENEWPSGQVVHRKWRDQGCYDEIVRRLGYRFVPLRLKVPDGATAGSSMQVEFEVRNDGFARFFKPRTVYLTLVGADGRADIELVGVDRTSDDDIRFWPPHHENGETRTIARSLAVPADLPAGDYDVAIWIPDPDFARRDDPNDAKYSVRLAAGDWDASKGFTKLGSIRITAANAKAP